MPCGWVSTWGTRNHSTIVPLLFYYILLSPLLFSVKFYHRLQCCSTKVACSQSTPSLCPEREAFTSPSLMLTRRVLGPRKPLPINAKDLFAAPHLVRKFHSTTLSPTRSGQPASDWSISSHDTMRPPNHSGYEAFRAPGTWRDFPQHGHMFSAFPRVLTKSVGGRRGPFRK